MLLGIILGPGDTPMRKDGPNIPTGDGVLPPAKLEPQIELLEQEIARLSRSDDPFDQSRARILRGVVESLRLILPKSDQSTTSSPHAIVNSVDPSGQGDGAAAMAPAETASDASDNDSDRVSSLAIAISDKLAGTLFSGDWQDTVAHRWLTAQVHDLLVAMHHNLATQLGKPLGMREFEGRMNRLNGYPQDALKAWFAREIQNHLPTDQARRIERLVFVGRPTSPETLRLSLTEEERQAVGTKAMAADHKDMSPMDVVTWWKDHQNIFPGISEAFTHLGEMGEHHIPNRHAGLAIFGYLLAERSPTIRALPTAGFDSVEGVLGWIATHRELVRREVPQRGKPPKSTHYSAPGLAAALYLYGKVDVTAVNYETLMRKASALGFVLDHWKILLPELKKVVTAQRKGRVGANRGKTGGTTLSVVDPKVFGSAQSRHYREAILGVGLEILHGQIPVPGKSQSSEDAAVHALRTANLVPPLPFKTWLECHNWLSRYGEKLQKTLGDGGIAHLAPTLLALGSIQKSQGAAFSEHLRWYDLGRRLSPSIFPSRHFVGVEKFEEWLTKDRLEEWKSAIAAAEPGHVFSPEDIVHILHAHILTPRLTHLFYRTARYAVMGDAVRAHALWPKEAMTVLDARDGTPGALTRMREITPRIRDELGVELSVADGLYLLHSDGKIAGPQDGEWRKIEAVALSEMSPTLQNFSGDPLQTSEEVLNWALAHRDTISQEVPTEKGQYSLAIVIRALHAAGRLSPSLPLTGLVAASQYLAFAIRYWESLEPEVHRVRALPNNGTPLFKKLHTHLFGETNNPSSNNVYRIYEWACKILDGRVCVPGLHVHGPIKHAGRSGGRAPSSGAQRTNMEGRGPFATEVHHPMERDPDLAPRIGSKVDQTIGFAPARAEAQGRTKYAARRTAKTGGKPRGITVAIAEPQNPLPDTLAVAIARLGGTRSPAVDDPVELASHLRSIHPRPVRPLGGLLTGEISGFWGPSASLEVLLRAPKLVSLMVGHLSSAGQTTSKARRFVRFLGRGGLDAVSKAMLLELDIHHVHRDLALSEALEAIPETITDADLITTIGALYRAHVPGAEQVLAEYNRRQRATFESSANNFLEGVAKNTFGRDLAKSWGKLRYLARSRGGDELETALQQWMQQAAHFFAGESDFETVMAQRLSRLTSQGGQLPWERIRTYAGKSDPVGRRAAALLNDIIASETSDLGFLLPDERSAWAETLGAARGLARSIATFVAARPGISERDTGLGSLMRISGDDAFSDAVEQLKSAATGGREGIANVDPLAVRELIHRAVWDPQLALSLLAWAATENHDAQVSAIRTADALMTEFDRAGAELSGNILSKFLSHPGLGAIAEEGAALYFKGRGNHVHFIPPDWIEFRTPSPDLLVWEARGIIPELVEIKSVVAERPDAVGYIMQRIATATRQLVEGGRGHPDWRRTIFLMVVVLDAAHPPDWLTSRLTPSVVPGDVDRIIVRYVSRLGTASLPEHVINGTRNVRPVVTVAAGIAAAKKLALILYRDGVIPWRDFLDTSFQLAVAPARDVEFAMDHAGDPSLLRQDLTALLGQGD